MQAPTRCLCSSAQQSKFAPFKPANARATKARVVLVNQKSGKVWGAEEENAAQVRRLISRDRKEFLGNDADILDKYTVELGGGKSAEVEAEAAALAASTSTPTIVGDTPNPFGSAASSNPFGSESPFGSASASTPFKRSIEPVGLRPDMSPDAIVKESPVDIIKSITLTQVVLFCSFTAVIGLMLATFNVVLNAGAIRIAGIE